MKWIKGNIIKFNGGKMKNKKKIAVLILIAMVAVGSYSIAGTYAKYTSSIAGTATGTVAKWKWTIGSSTIDSTTAATNGYTFNLFATIKEADTSTSESDVASSKIAPGTGGSFDVSVKNESEVNATYAIAFTETNTSSIPIEYSSDGSTWVSSVSSLNISATNIDMGDTSSSTTVYWRWAFEGSSSSNYISSQTDATDTALGFAANTAAPTVTVTATVTVTQRD